MSGYNGPGGAPNRERPTGGSILAFWLALIGVSVVVGVLADALGRL